jgi:transcriptional regulator
MLPVEAKGGEMPEPIELPQGTLDLLILRTLALEPQHGWGISERVQQMSSDVLRIQQGSLYPALHRLERRGWVIARWGTSENNRRAKYYELTKTGRKQLASEQNNWQKLTAAVAQVLGPPEEFPSCGRTSCFAFVRSSSRARWKPSWMTNCASTPNTSSADTSNPA